MTGSTLKVAAHWMAGIMGLDPIKDREEAVEFVNKYRNLLYNSYDRIKLFTDYEQCFTITSFHQDCHGHGCSTYRGFSATLDMDGVEGAWESLSPVTLRSSWREVATGINSPRGSKVELVPVSGTFATERDMTASTKLKLYASSKNDDGKQVNIKAKNSAGEVVDMIYTLNGDNHVISHNIVCKVLEVALPVDLCGSVELLQEDGYSLSKYPTGVSAPRYRRFRVHDSYYCSSNTILVKYNRQFIPVSEDHELVEIGDRLVIEAAGKYFKYGDNTTDRKQKDAAKGYLADMYENLRNIKSRTTGRSTEDGNLPNQSRARRPRRHRLPGYRY